MLDMNCNNASARKQQLKLKVIDEKYYVPKLKYKINDVNK